MFNVDNKLIIVRYSEIALKGKETRKFFEKTLIKNLKKAMKKEKISFQIQREWGRIYILSDDLDIVKKVCKKIFGIASFSQAVETQPDIDTISKKSLIIIKQELKNCKTFAVRVTRTGDHNYSSQDVAVRLGSDILKIFNLKVNLDSPEFELFIEIRNQRAFIFTGKNRGPGGLPVGTQDKVLIYANNIESVLAGWYLIRRGCVPYFLIKEGMDKKIIENFVNDWYLESNIFSKSNNLDVFSEINLISEKYEIDALVTSFNLFENTIKKLVEMKIKTKLPIFHPLIILTKEEVIKNLEQIGIKK